LSDPNCPIGQTFKFPTPGPKDRPRPLPITGQTGALDWGTPPLYGRGGDGLKARLFRLIVSVGMIAMLAAVLGAVEKWG
jgi:hypothetical protein